MQGVARAVVWVALMLLVVGCGKEQTQSPPAPTTGTLTGLVSDTSGKAQPGAEVSTEPASGFAVTDAAGGYKIEGVPAGTYSVRATRSGFEPALREGVSVQAGGSAIADLVLKALVVKGAIAGKVSDAKTHSAIAGAALVTVPAAAQATSAADGSYRLEVAPGAYAVAATASGYDALTSAQLTVAAGATASLDLQLVATVHYNSTCEECHVSAERLLADLTIDPPPAPPASTGSTGEG